MSYDKIWFQVHYNSSVTDQHKRVKQMQLDKQGTL